MTAREVELTGGAPWGFRMHGGADQNQPLRISRVNPGRKASLSGIREGDVISSINGRPTRGMSNADAHAMLRTAGPLLRLGLNEDREMSPRRRSIGKGSDLKRPSQLIADVQSGRATPQAPVYATIRPSQSPQARSSSSAMRSSLSSLPAALNSTPLVKSVASNEEPLRFHPTNPFYTTLPSNYSSASKLPLPNGRASLSSLDRNKSKDTSLYEGYNSDLKSPILFSKTRYDSGPSSLTYSQYNNTGSTNGYESFSKSAKSKCDPFTYEHKFNHFNNQNDANDIRNSTKNPFDTKRNSDPFEKYLRPEIKINGKCDYDGKNMTSSISDNNFQSREEITKRSTITEHKINKVEEVKTIKKLILNGCDDRPANQNIQDPNAKLPRPNSKHNDLPSEHTIKVHHFTTEKSPRMEQGNNIVIQTQQRNDYFDASYQNENNGSKYANSTKSYRSPQDNNIKSPLAETPASEADRDTPLKSPITPTVHNPTSKRSKKFVEIETDARIKRSTINMQQDQALHELIQREKILIARENNLLEHEQMFQDLQIQKNNN